MGPVLKVWIHGSNCRDRKSTRLNSSHVAISYAVFCLIPPPLPSTLFPYTTLFRSFDNQQFIDGDVATDFIDKNPYLTQINRSKDRGSRALAYLADVTVNQPYGPRIEGMDPRLKLPHFPGDKSDEPDRSPFDGPSQVAPPPGWRDILLEQGPESFAQALRNHNGLGVTDTTFRDAHQSLLATRIRTRDMLAAAPAVSHLLPELVSAEVWGGATYDEIGRAHV